MGSFHRSGTFRDRALFLQALKAKLARLQEGALRGASIAWEDEASDVTRGTLTGFGARVQFIVRASDWECGAEVPVFVPQSMVEEKFDREFRDLGDL